MNEQNKKVPTLRFKGFTNDWEQRKLGDFGKVAMNKRIFKNQTSDEGDVPFYKIGTFGGVADSYITKELFEEYKLKYPYPRKGDLLISASGSIGRVIEYNGKDEYFQDSNIVWLDHDNRLDNSFLKQFYNIIKWQGLEGSTIKRLYNKNILATKIDVPSISEQLRIGDFLQQFDTLITLQQRKLDLLKQLKKGLLQKMFADKGSKRPILRFSGFKGDLVNKRLEEISKIRGGFSFKSNSFKKQGVPIIRISNIKNDGSVVGPFVFYTPLDEDAAFTLEGESIIIAMSGATTGKIASINSKQKYYQNQRVGFFEKTSCVNYDYLKYLLDTEKLRENLRKVLIAGAQPNISGKDIDKFEFVITTDQHEQKEIAKLFGSLEDDILHQKSKVSKIKSLKKFFLQKMFI